MQAGAARAALVVPLFLRPLHPLDPLRSAGVWFKPAGGLMFDLIWPQGGSTQKNIFAPVIEVQLINNA